MTSKLQFILNMAKAQTIVTRRFDSGLDGLGFTEFAILHYLSKAEKEKLRRVDLAEKVGLTASGVTRLLVPMEKIGLVKRQTDPTDARVSYVLLASGGKRKLSEALERAERLAEDLFSSMINKQEPLYSLLEQLRKQ